MHARMRAPLELAAALRAWLDGSARRARADLAVAAAAASVETIDALRLERDELVQDAAQMLARVRDFDPVEAKLPPETDARVQSLSGIIFCPSNSNSSLHSHFSSPIYSQLPFVQTCRCRHLELSRPSPSQPYTSTS